MNSNSFQKRVYVSALFFLLLSTLFINDVEVLHYSFNPAHLIIPIITLLAVLHFEYNDIFAFIKNIVSKSKLDTFFLIGLCDILVLGAYLLISNYELKKITGSVLFLFSSFTYLLIHVYVVTNYFKARNIAVIRILITKFLTRLLELFFVFISIFMIISVLDYSLLLKLPVFVLVYIESFFVFDLADKELSVLDIKFSDFLSSGETALLFLNNVLVKLIFFSYLFYQLVPVVETLYVNQFILFVLVLLSGFISKKLYNINSRFVFRTNTAVMIVINVVIYMILKFKGMY